MSQRLSALIIAAVILTTSVLVLWSISYKPQGSPEEKMIFRISASSPETMKAWNDLPSRYIGIASLDPWQIKSDIGWGNIARSTQLIENDKYTAKVHQALSK